MAEDKFSGFLVGFILLSLFATLILYAVINAGNNYNMDTSNFVGGALDFNKFNASISNITANAESMQEAFSQDNIWSSFGLVIIPAIFGIVTGMFKMALTPFNLVLNIMSDVLGIPIWVGLVLLGILILSIILAIYRLLKIGD